MNIVIAGAGAVGTHLAKMLSRQEHNIMLIDTNQDKLEDLESQIDILSIVGSCTSIGALKDAEVGKCDLYIAVNPQEDQNINSAILAKKLGAKRTIARVNNSEYLEIENAEYLFYRYRFTDLSGTVGSRRNRCFAKTNRFQTDA